MTPQTPLKREGRRGKGRKGEGKESRGKGKGRGKESEGDPPKRPVFWFCVVGNPKVMLWSPHAIQN